MDPLFGHRLYRYAEQHPADERSRPYTPAPGYEQCEECLRLAGKYQRNIEQAAKEA